MTSLIADGQEVGGKNRSLDNHVVVFGILECQSLYALDAMLTE